MLKLSGFVLAATVATLISSTAVEACVYASEADQLLGWTEDGRYALYARTNGTAHTGAEIHPTQLRQDPVYWIFREGDDLVVRAKSQVSCQPWAGNEVERKPLGRGEELAYETIERLETVRKLRFRRAKAATVKADTLSASFRPRRRYADHRVVVQDPAGTYNATLDLPVGCVGSCLRDEAWKSWRVQVIGIHQADSLNLYELRISRMCNGGRDKEMWMTRLVATRSPDDPRPKRRCKFGAGAR